MTRIKSYNYTGGGLITEELPTSKKFLLSTPKNFTIPKYVDSRPYCIPASNQGNEPACAGYATAGYTEVMNWQYTNIAEQVDGLGIYNAAKKLDGDPKSDGTTLTAAVEGAMKLKLIPNDYEVKTIQTLRDVQFALHRDGVCIAGFNITDEWNKVDVTTGRIWHNGKSKVLGGHAVLICYYDEEYIGWQNSWGEWGCDGFGMMDYEQFKDQFMYAVTLEAPSTIWGVQC